MTIIFGATVSFLVAIIILDWIVFNNWTARKSLYIGELKAELENLNHELYVIVIRLAENEARAKRSAAVAKGNKTRKAVKAAAKAATTAK